MKVLLLIWFGKIIALVIRTLGVGAGSTWPGHLAFEAKPEILSLFVKQLQKGTIVVAGTNGKTTTASMVKAILERGKPGVDKSETICNESGANLLNGIVSACIQKSSWLGKIKASWAIFEVDEATLPLVLKEFTPKIVVLLNLFRDQLDRYGEIDLIAEKWQKALSLLPRGTTVVLNADDPHVAFLGKNLTAKVIYFGLNDPSFFLKKREHAVDSVYCPNCGKKLDFSGFFFSHLGPWSCSNCRVRRPGLDLSSWSYSKKSSAYSKKSSAYPLPGVYNRYNTLAAVLVAKVAGVKEKDIDKNLDGFKPAFGRQEEFEINDKKIKILLSKNPAGFNESIRVLKEFPGKKKKILLVLNDRIPDGRDVSWIWDVDFENIANYADHLIISGERVYDMALRLKYSGFNVDKMLINANLREAIKNGLAMINEGETLYVLPTYSAMLEVRKIVAGRKIL